MVLVAIIGMLNLSLGFGLAMYYGYGPAGLGGLLLALGPMPPIASDAVPRPESGGVETDRASLAAQPLAAEKPAASAGNLAEETVLGEVHALAADAEAALAPAAEQRL